MVDIDEVKNYLNRTYDDPESDKKLMGVMKRAESKVRKLIGAVNGEELEPDEEQLLLDCCRYFDNNAAEEFEGNFRETINSLRAAREMQKTRERQDFLTKIMLSVLSMEISILGVHHSTILTRKN